MATPSTDPGAFGISPEDWHDADSYTDLASVYEELGRIDILDQVVVRHLQCSKAIKGTQAPQPSPLSSQDSSSTSDYRWRDAAICIDRRREALRSRAAFLSRGETRDIQLMDLPVELLAMITNQFRYSASLDRTAEDFIAPFSRSDLQAVQSLRLVSRLFNSLSTPLLYPIVRLSLSQKSLDRVQAVCSNPLMASGVRAIRVGLENHPIELVRDIDGWLHYHIDKLGMKHRRLSSSLAQNAFRRKAAEKAGSVEQAKHFHEAMEDIRRAIDRSKVVRFAMRQMSSGTELVPDESDEERVARYRVLVRHCHDEFSRAYEEQVRLLLDKSFVSSVARLALHASHPVALELIAREFRYPKSAKNEFRYLASGVSWHHEGGAGNDEQQQQAIRIIHDLPVAIHQAGGVINAFKLGCPPMVHHLHFMEGLTDRDWALLNAAFQQLKIFQMPNLSFSYHSRLLRLSEEQKVHSEAYFSALIDRQNLEEVSFDGQIYLGFNASGSIEHGGIWGVLERMFGRAYWPRIKRIKFSKFSIAQTHIEGLFQGLGTSINQITLNDIHLESGSWIPAIDILQKRVKQTLGSGSLNECSVHLKALSGVEMGRLDIEAVGPVMEALESYILGKGPSDNPLLKYALS
ncbi:unnamed protein product [Clonostachys rosea f. rosea IK726]|uniref:Uncharacterized protein n=1 Tax=Clonostachys rosea f. rosea IK726 TaxID=1349383 RepID=A0ACA9T901_BIOOC|nr:unnamed protein product [Clonostachys rosea f. rosea IK726]